MSAELQGQYREELGAVLAVYFKECFKAVLGG
jgi:hypothetical protein